MTSKSAADHDLTWSEKIDLLAGTMPAAEARALSSLLPGYYFGIDAIYQTHQLDKVIAIAPATIDYVDRSIVEEAARQDSQIMIRLRWQLM